MIPEIIRDLTMKKGGAVKEAVKGASKGAKQAAKASKVTLKDYSKKKLERFLEDSAVKDRLYHGTKYDISKFRPSLRLDLGTHLGTTDQANQFTMMGDKAVDRGNVMPVYASIKNPLRLEDRGRFDAQRIGEQLIDMDLMTEDEFEKLQYLQPDQALKVVQKHIEDAGHDSVVYLNRREGFEPFGPDGVDGEELNEMLDREVEEMFPEAMDSYIVFKPTQIKSAIGNRGSFDPTNPDITKAKGGAVGVAKGALEGAKKAAKAAKKHPIVFKPAAPLGKEEIRKMAQQMAEQTTGEFVRPDPTKSVNPAGKSKKQFERERDLRKVIRANVPEKEAPFVDIAGEEGNLIVAVPGDPTIGGVLRGGSLNEPPRGTHELVAIDDVEFDVPVQLYGGPRYGDEEKFWASNVSAASGIQNPVTEFSQAMGDRPVIGMYTKMTPESSRFALHTLDSLLAYQQPHRLPKKTRAELTKLVKAGNPKAGKFPGFAGFDDPETVLLQAKQDPELRKHISKVLAMPSVNAPLKMRPGLDVLSAISHPEIENLQTGASGFSLGVLRPGAGLTESIHPTYSHDIPGEFLGQTRYPIPAELAFPRTMSYVRENIPTGQPFNTMKMVGAREVIDPQYIDQIKMYEELMKKYTGRKKGGLASIKKVRKNG